MTRRDIDHHVAALARRQHGAFNLAQVEALGGDRSLARRRTTAGAWVRLDRTVFALPGNPGTWRRQAKAAELSHPLAVVSGRSAALLHGLPGISPGRPEITVPASTHLRSTLANVRRCNGVRSTSLDGFRAVPLADTLVDLGRTSPEASVQRAVEHAVLRGWIDLDHLFALAQQASASRTHGARLLHSVLAELTRTGAPSESELERRLRAAVDAAGIGGVIYQATPPWWPTGAQRLDALVPWCAVILEADGRAWHTRVADFERDRQRDNLAARHGYRVLRLTWPALTRHLADTVALLAATCRALPENGPTPAFRVLRVTESDR